MCIAFGLCIISCSESKRICFYIATQYIQVTEFDSVHASKSGIKLATKKQHDAV
jgi:hypothetical protein